MNCSIFTPSIMSKDFHSKTLKESLMPIRLTIISIVIMYTVSDS